MKQVSPGRASGHRKEITSRAVRTCQEVSCSKRSDRWKPKSLKPQAYGPLPEETTRVANTAYPKGNVWMRMRDELGTI